jgi:hypothetical protein
MVVRPIKETAIYSNRCVTLYVFKGNKDKEYMQTSVNVILWG